MKHFYVTIASLIPFYCVSNAFVSNAIAGEITTPSSCNVVGRVLESYDSGIPDFARLCENGKIIVGDQLKVKISCHAKAKNRWLYGGSYSVDQLCKENRLAKSVCWFKPFCTRATSKLSIKSPKTSVVEINEETPLIEWSGIETADEYKLKISRSGKTIIETATIETQFNLKDHVVLKPGEFYSIEITAFKDSAFIDKGAVSFKVLSQDEQNEIEKNLEKVNSMSMESHERILLIDSIYRSSGLSLKAIAFLEKEAQVSRTLLVAKLLADHYSEISDPINARVNYEIMAKQSPIDSEDYDFANKMLERINQYPLSSSSAL